MVLARLLLVILVSILQHVDDVTLALFGYSSFDSSLNYLYVNHPYSPLPVEYLEAALTMALIGYLDYREMLVDEFWRSLPFLVC